MKQLFRLTRFVVSLLMLSTAVIAQDVSINAITQQNDVNDGDWPLDAPAKTTYILMTFCNNDQLDRVVPEYKLRPLISVPGAIVQVAPNAEQTDLPPGWTILSNNGNSIRLSNGTDTWGPFECREFKIYVKPTAMGGPLTITTTLAFANGQAPGSTTGSQTEENDPSNDNSTTAVKIGSALPVTLVSFNVVKENKTALLSWATTQETNSDFFEIQHSITGKAWEPVGKMSSHGESSTLKNYSFTHSTPVNGENLYRLKMVDKDATFAYSRIQSVKFDGLTDSDLSVYPNPVTDKLFIRDFSQVTQVKINDMNGRSVYQSAGSSTGEVDVKNLSTGMYIVSITRSNGISSSQKIVISK